MPPKYKIIDDWKEGHCDSEYELDKLGLDGWELVTVLEVIVDIMPPVKGYRWIFKKVPVHI